MRRILVRATNWIGDAVMSLPALRQIRVQYPDAYIAVLALEWVADLYGRESFLNEVIPYTAKRGARDWKGKWRLAAKLRERRFDGAILLQNAFEAALVVWLARIPVRIGYDRDGRGPLLTHAIARPGKGEIQRHESFYYLELLRRAGMSVEFPREPLIRLEGIAEARLAGLHHLHDGGLSNAVIGISPGAAYGNAKRWPAERFAEAASIVADARRASVALFGSSAERELCDVVALRLRESAISTRNFAGETTLRQFIEMTAACQAMITNDSGAMHIASALAVPTVTVFGATDHIGTGPTGPLARIVRQPVDCSPYPNPCLLRECPIDHRCMKAVSAQQVAQTVLELLR